MDHRHQNYETLPCDKTNLTYKFSQQIISNVKLGPYCMKCNIGTAIFPGEIPSSFIFPAVPAPIILSEDQNFCILLTAENHVSRGHPVYLIVLLFNI